MMAMPPFPFVKHDFVTNKCFYKGKTLVLKMGERVPPYRQLTLAEVFDIATVLNALRSSMQSGAARWISVASQEVTVPGTPCFIFFLVCSRCFGRSVGCLILVLRSPAQSRNSLKQKMSELLKSFEIFKMKKYVWANKNDVI